MNLLTNGLAFSLPVALCCLSLYMSVRVLRFADLSLPGAYLLGAYSYCILIAAGTPWILALIVAALTGGAIGSLTGLLHYGLSLNSLLAGVVVFFLARGLAARLAMGGSLDGSHSPIVNVPENEGMGALCTRTEARLGAEWGRMMIVHAAISIILLLFVGLVMAWFVRTRLGTAARAVGANREAARHVGLSLGALGTLGLALAGTLAGVGGASALFVLRAATLDIASHVLVESFAAFFLGEVLLLAFLRQDRTWTWYWIVGVSSLGSLVHQVMQTQTRAWAARLGWVAPTDYALTFSTILGVVAFVAARRTRSALGTPLNKPLVLY